MSHAPEVQLGAPFGGIGQTASQTPQLNSSESSLTQLVPQTE